MRISTLSVLAVFALLAGIAPSRCTLAADNNPGDVAAEVQSDLAAGEFAPALRRAEAVQDPGLHDRLLSDIAAAQHAVGAGDAATQTVGRIRNDQLRAGAVANILAQQLAPPNPILAQGAVGGGAAGGGLGGAGGGAAGGAGQQLDFQPIIDLIKATIEPDSWDDAGGPGAIKDFPGGVLVDTDGLLQRIVKTDATGDLEALRRTAATHGSNAEVRHAANLRKVSLTRLERAIQMARAAGRNPDEAMRYLAGLQRIEFVLLYPETGDIVLAGPAGDWRRLAEGRVVSVDNGHPVVQLDDLAVILRHSAKEHVARFGCSIDPLPENIARTKAYTDEVAQRKLGAGDAAVKEFADAIQQRMGRQAIDVFGIDPRTRVGRVLVEADYRMKLVGMGRERPAGDLVSYWDMLKGKAQPASMIAVRWWFTLNYDAVQATPAREAFAITGQGVKLLSENEMLGSQGRRVPTGQADELNRRFAQSFTKNFPALAAKYPIYAELQNMFDLALACSLITSERLPEKVGWHMSGLLDDAQYHVALGAAPKTVESVARYRSDEQGHVVVQVSGGVRVDTQQLVGRDKIETAQGPSLDTEHGRAKPAVNNAGAWWWD